MQILECKTPTYQTNIKILKETRCDALEETMIKHHRRIGKIKKHREETLEDELHLLFVELGHVEI